MSCACSRAARSANDPPGPASTSSSVTEVKSPMTEPIRGCSGGRLNSDRLSVNRCCADHSRSTSENAVASTTDGVRPRAAARRLISAHRSRGTRVRRRVNSVRDSWPGCTASGSAGARGSVSRRCVQYASARRASSPDAAAAAASTWSRNETASGSGSSSGCS